MVRDGAEQRRRGVEVRTWWVGPAAPGLAQPRRRRRPCIGAAASLAASRPGRSTAIITIATVNNIMIAIFIIIISIRYHSRSPGIIGTVLVRILHLLYDDNDKVCPLSTTYSSILFSFETCVSLGESERAASCAVSHAGTQARGQPDSVRADGGRAPLLPQPPLPLPPTPAVAEWLSTCISTCRGRVRLRASLLRKRVQGD